MTVRYNADYASLHHLKKHNAVYIQLGRKSTDRKERLQLRTGDIERELSMSGRGINFMLVPLIHMWDTELIDGNLMLFVILQKCI